MGNITQYDAGNLGLQPSETGVEAAAGAGRRIGAFSNQAAEDLKGVGQEFASAIRTTGGTVNQVLENREINTGGMHAATFTLNHNQAWHDYITGADIPDDPDNPNARQDAITARINNPGAASQWIENTLDPDLDKFKDGFLTEGGQKWAQGWVDRYRQHAVTTAIADQSSMAGAVVQANIEKTGNTLATDTFNHPANLGVNFDLLDHSIKGNVSSSPTITPDVATRILQEHSTAEKEKLVQSAIQGAITKGGDWRSIASDPKYAPYVKPGENEQFERQEQTFQKVNEANARAARAENDYNVKKDFNGRLEKMELETIPDNPGDPPKPIANFKDRMTALASHPGADLEHGEFSAMIAKQKALAEKLGKPEPLAGVSHATTMDLLGRMRATDDSRLTDNGAIFKAYGDGKLNNADFNFLQTQFQQSKTPDGERLDKDRDLFFKRFSYQFDPGMGQDAATAGNTYLAEMAARQKETEVRAKGGNPGSVYDPDSPNFFGTAANINKYKVPLQLQLQTLPSARPDVGAVQKGYRFIGGDPSKPESWAKVQ